MFQTDRMRRKFLSAGFMSTMGFMTMGGSLYNLFSHLRMKKLPGGFWPVMMTPYKQDLSIDYEGLKRLIHWYEDAGSTGLFANCASSEMYQLTAEERIELTRFVVKNSKVPVVSTGTFYDNTEENIEFIREIHKTGVEAVVLIPSILVKKGASDSELLKNFERVLDQTSDIPLGIYECPGPYHRLISPEMLDQLQATGRFYYFKDTSCDANAVDQKIDVSSGSPLGIYNAHSPDALHSIQHGGDGISCIAGNFYPELFSFIWSKGRKKKVSESVVKVNDFIRANDPIISKKYPLAAKYFMNLRGLNLIVNSRKNTPELDQSDKDRLDVLWENLRTLSQEVHIDLVSYL